MKGSGSSPLYDLRVTNPYGTQTAAQLDTKIFDFNPRCLSFYDATYI